ncbi:MAG: TlpA disulfide reductase family protein [Chloroflexota bacterium]
MRFVYISLLVFLLVGCGVSNEPSASTNADGSETSENNTELATNFVLPTLAGDELALESLRGQYVLVNFWATWCIPCREEMPYLQSISEIHSDQLVVLGINMGEDVERVQPFVADMALTFPILLDPPETLTTEHGVRGLPVSFVVGPTGEIVYRRVGEILPEEFDVWLAENL